MLLGLCRISNFNLKSLVGKILVSLSFITIALFASSPLVADRGLTAKMCDDAIELIAAETHSDVSVLRAISRVETGRNLSGEVQSWPWAVNSQGKGYWFESEEDAREFIVDALSHGVRNIDVGCFQINYRWHGNGFVSVDDLLDPVNNTRYAESFLRSLIQESGSLRVAVGWFHSRTPELSAVYLQKIESQLKEMSVQVSVSSFFDRVDLGLDTIEQTKPQDKSPAGLGSLFSRYEFVVAQPVAASLITKDLSHE